MSVGQSGRRPCNIDSISTKERRLVREFHLFHRLFPETRQARRDWSIWKTNASVLRRMSVRISVTEMRPAWTPTLDQKIPFCQRRREDHYPARGVVHVQSRCKSGTTREAVDGMTMISDPSVSISRPTSCNPWTHRPSIELKKAAHAYTSSQGLNGASEAQILTLVDSPTV